MIDTGMTHEMVLESLFPFVIMVNHTGKHSLPLVTSGNINVVNT